MVNYLELLNQAGNVHRRKNFFNFYKKIHINHKKLNHYINFFRFYFKKSLNLYQLNVTIKYV